MHGLRQHARVAAGLLLPVGGRPVDRRHLRSGERGRDGEDGQRRQRWQRGRRKQTPTARDDPDAANVSSGSAIALPSPMVEPPPTATQQSAPTATAMRARGRRRLDRDVHHRLVEDPGGARARGGGRDLVGERPLARRAQHQHARARPAVRSRRSSEANAPMPNTTRAGRPTCTKDRGTHLTARSLRSAARVVGGNLRVDVDPHRFGFGVLVHRLEPHLAAVAGLPDARRTASPD